MVLAGRTLPPAPGASRMAALRALHPDRKARGYSQKDASCATRKMRSRLVFFAAVWRGLFFFGYCRFVSSRRQASGDSPPNRPKPCTPSLSTRANFSARAPARDHTRGLTRASQRPRSQCDRTRPAHVLHALAGLIQIVWGLITLLARYHRA